MCVDELDWQGLNPYFIGLSILILPDRDDLIGPDSLNPYFIGLSILIVQQLHETDPELAVSILILLDYLFLYDTNTLLHRLFKKSQSLFYWIIYSYVGKFSSVKFIIYLVSILILLDYLFLY